MQGNGNIPKKKPVNPNPGNRVLPHPPGNQMVQPSMLQVQVPGPMSENQSLLSGQNSNRNNVHQAPQIHANNPSNMARNQRPNSSSASISPDRRVHPHQEVHPTTALRQRVAQVNRNQNVQQKKDSNNDGSGGCYGWVQRVFGDCQGFFGTWLPCFTCCPNPYKTVPQGFGAWVFRFGKYYKTVGPGMHYINPQCDEIYLKDKREKVVELHQQTVVTKDNVTFKINPVLFYRVFNIDNSGLALRNSALALKELAATTLRTAIGRMTLQQFLHDRETFAEQVRKEMQPVTKKWGVHVPRVAVQEFHINIRFQGGAVAKQQAEAKLIEAQTEVEVARLMREAANELNTEAAFQIRYVDALEQLSRSSNRKMIFFPANYSDVGTANQDLVSSMVEEMDGLLSGNKDITASSTNHGNKLDVEVRTGKKKPTHK